MACDAIARLYDVDEDSAVFTKLQKTEQYDQGTFVFRARKGRLIDLDKLHESVWATRLSGGTRSGLVSLDVVAVGQIVVRGEKVVLRVSGAESTFLLGAHPDEEYKAVFSRLKSLPEGKSFRVTGRVDEYRGRWPNLLRSKPKKPRRLLVSNVQSLDKLAGRTR